MEAWKKFVQTRYGNFVNEFYKKLNGEIAGTNNNSDGNSGQSSVLILNTKKGYWLYKIFEREEKESVYPIEVYSDRYVKKNIEPSFFENKLIYLVDDTLAHGYNLLGAYRQLAKFVDANYICPLVFALSDAVDIEKKVEKASDRTEILFWESLKYYVRMPENEMGSFCVQVTKLLHDEGIPYVIDLPYLKMESRQSFKTDFEVIISQKQFELLQKGNELWEFHFNSYSIYNQEFLNGFVIQMKDQALLDASHSYILNYVIEGTYRIDDNGNICMVFVPFAIGKSIPVNGLKRLWNALLGDISSAPPEETSGERYMYENRLKKYYRESIYVLSMVVAERFSKYLETFTGIKLVYDYHILKDHFSTKFIECVKQIETSYKLSPDIFYKDLLQNMRNSRVEEKYSKDEFLDDQILEEDYSEDEVYEIAAVQVLEQGKNYQLKAEDNITVLEEQDAAVKFEDMDDSLGHTFRFSSEEERRYLFSKIIVTLVQTSIAGGQIYTDQKRNMVCKAFRYGENSDLALPFFNIEFYWALILLMEKKNRSKASVLKIYDSFVKDLKRKFSELGLLGQKFSEKKFYRNKEYYKDVLQNDLPLYNKCFFLESYLRGELPSENYYMKEIEKFVREYYLPGD